MSARTLSFGFTIAGLIFEFGALFWILWSVGLGNRVRDRIRWVAVVLRRAKAQALRVCPWYKPERTVVQVGTAVMEAEGAMRMRAMKRRNTNRPPPTSLAEVGERLNVIALNLNEHETLIHQRSDEVMQALQGISDKNAEVAKQRADDLEMRLTSQSDRVFRERQTEGLIFGIGVLLQIVGASLGYAG